jgi:rhodanese-related sulfurtransferase
MPMTHLSVTDAHAAQSRGLVYIDVRSTQEFAEGHPVGAINIPLQEPDEDTGQTMTNPDFVRVMTTNFDPDTPLLIGCRTGGRSVRASQMLEVFGFSQLINVKGGFEGWTMCELPTATSPHPGHTWPEQLAKADDADR